MRISATGLRLIKKFEGCRLEAYLDVAGIPTIGYGHTSPEVHLGLKISQELAETLLEKDLARFERGVKQSLLVPVNQNEFDALVSFAYNIGLNAFKSSTLLSLLNSNATREIVAAEFKRWVKAAGKENQGLISRRRAETELFLTTVPNQLLASSILAKQDTWLKRKPVQSSALAAEEKVFVPKGSAHMWSEITILPGETDYRIKLQTQPDSYWYFYPSHFKIINDPKPEEKPAASLPKDKLVLDVPYFSQRDNAKDPMRTCFSSSCAMLLKYLKPTSINTDDDYIKTVFSIGDTTEAWVQLEALKRYKVSAKFLQNCGWSDIDSLLAKQIPVPIGILHHGPVSAPRGNGHWIIIIGRTSDNARYIVNDPFGELDLVSGGYINTNGANLTYSKKNLGPRFMPAGPGSGWIIAASKP